MTLGKCEKCNKEASLICTNCKSASYCSRDCQKTHWKSHKTACQPFEIKKNEKLGRYLTVKREIKKNATILTESPLIIGPKWSRDVEDESLTFRCVGCYEPIPVLSCKCPGCHWPACSLNCIGLINSDLHQIECALLKVGKGPKVQTDIHSLHNYFRFDVILAMKILVLQNKNPKKYEAIMELESNEAKRKSTENYKDADEKINYIEENYLEPLLKAEEKMGKTILAQKDRKLLHKIFGIIETNAMYISLPTETEISGIYPTACLLEHSCIPNCGYRFDMKNGFKLILEPARDIKSGENLTTSYSHILWTTQLRQQHLKDTKYFSCTCPRCKDPTELGTNFSTLRCIGVEENPCNGFQLPCDPLSKKTEWACNKCQIRVENAQVDFILGKMNDEVENLQGSTPSPSAVEDLIDKFAPFLHPNHQHMFSLKHSLIQLYGNHKDFPIEKLTPSQLNRKLELIAELLKITEVLDPASIRIPMYTAILYYEKFAAMKEHQRRAGGQLDVKEAKKYLQVASEILKNETNDPQGKQLFQKVENALIML